jgi:hypothetical protein
MHVIRIGGPLPGSVVVPTNDESLRLVTGIPPDLKVFGDFTKWFDW